MVDVSARIEERAYLAAGASQVHRRTAGSVAAAVTTGAGALAAYRRIAAGAAFSPPQSPAWIEAWSAEAGHDLIVATLEIGGAPALALALEVHGSGPFRVARFLSGRHANGNFSPMVVAAARPRRSDLAVLFDAIATARPDIDMIAMERLLPEHAGLSNPFVSVKSGDSPNISLAVDLEGGFDALLQRSSGKRKRKKHRSQTRKFEAAGGFRIIEARTPDEVDRVLGAFCEMKRIRLTKMGVENVFGGAEVQAFFRRLFLDAATHHPPAFVLHALEVGGTIRAVTGSSRTTDRIICEFGAIVEDELAHASPGDFLFFEHIQAAAGEGLAYYDFSVGDELYKRLWCDVEAVHFDVFVPLTAKGRVLVFAERAGARLKSFVKNNAAIWSLVKRMRRRDSAPAQQTEGDD